MPLLVGRLPDGLEIQVGWAALVDAADIVFDMTDLRAAQLGASRCPEVSAVVYIDLSPPLHCVPQPMGRAGLGMLSLAELHQGMVLCQGFEVIGPSVQAMNQSPVDAAAATGRMVDLSLPANQIPHTMNICI